MRVTPDGPLSFDIHCGTCGGAVSAAGAASMKVLPLPKPKESSDAFERHPPGGAPIVANPPAWVNAFLPEFLNFSGHTGRPAQGDSARRVALGWLPWARRERPDDWPLAPRVTVRCIEPPLAALRNRTFTQCICAISCSREQRCQGGQ